MNYRVGWHHGIVATDPEWAARWALLIQQKPRHPTTLEFEVIQLGEDGEVLPDTMVIIDLNKPTEQQEERE